MGQFPPYLFQNACTCNKEQKPTSLKYFLIILHNISGYMMSLIQYFKFDNMFDLSTVEQCIIVCSQCYTCAFACVLGCCLVSLTTADMENKFDIGILTCYITGAMLLVYIISCRLHTILGYYIFNIASNVFVPI